MGYESLIAIYDEAIKLAMDEEFSEPTECPNDGTILIKNSAGVLHCKFDGFVWNGINNGSEV
jgi:hypothetical protein